jgi:hypothetical protein
MPVFVVAPEDAEFAGLNPIDRSHGEQIFQRGNDATSLSIGDFTFDFAKIGNRATVLFPFLTPGLALEYFGLAPQPNVPGGFHDPASPSRKPTTSEIRSPLVIGDAALQSLIDTSWSRRQRWSAFQRVMSLANASSPDTGRLPDVLHAYVDQNWVQPYADTTSRDPRLWTELGLAADHVDFVGFVSRYASEHPSTQATTELLLLLDKIAQASHDDLMALLNTNPSEHLQTTRVANRPAYDLIVRIRAYYAAELERKGLTSTEAVAGYYDRIRLAILTGILHTTPHGYRASDARFLIGTIYWSQGRAHEALETWSDLTVDPSDSYVTAYSAILAAIRTGAPASAARTLRDQWLRRYVDRILETEHGRWLVFSYERLRRFGYRFDTF